MTMTIKQRMVQTVVFLQIEGAMVIDTDRDFLKERVAQLLEARQAKIVLDLKNCLWISDLCIKALVWCREQAQEKGGDCRLVHVDKAASLMLLLEGEYKGFQTFRNHDAAAESFN